MASSVLEYCRVIIFVHCYSRSNSNLFSKQKSKHIRLASKKKSISIGYYNNNIIYEYDSNGIIYGKENDIFLCLLYDCSMDTLVLLLIVATMESDYIIFIWCKSWI